MTNKKIAIVTSITGMQAQAIAQGFIAAGYHVRGLSRKPSAIIDNIETVTVDPTDAGALAGTFEGADVVAFTSPIDYRDGVREKLAETLVKAAEKSGIRRIVSNAAAAVLEDYDRPVSQSMRAIRDIILSAKVESVALQPTVYMDNLIAPWAKPAIVEQGVLAYPMHPQARVSWISHASLGAFMAAAATVSLNQSRIFNIGGPEALTGDEVASILSRVIGRTVRYQFVPPPEFAKGLNQAFGEPVGDHIGDLYRYVETHHDALARKQSDYAALGITPESFENWAKRQSWV